MVWVCMVVWVYMVSCMSISSMVVPHMMVPTVNCVPSIVTIFRVM